MWTQLSLSLRPLLTYRVGVDHSLVLQWSHRRLREWPRHDTAPAIPLRRCMECWLITSGTSSEKRDPESDDKSDSLEALYAVNTQHCS
ncbi:hypothetical protein GBAR_LOCUS3482 [Geodia barretti]|uniref:Uncharacterized protein n=1 Tax=Geodia barretti TaxID=519541 RepID=A0AA35R3T7_GEOBA|nr:hypothetical protein GBAR_LOCUS3482 [Geodia barretti]